MQKNNYQLKFIAGELAGRSFVLPPEGLLIGRSRAAAIRPGGEDIQIEHAALYIREADGALMLESRAEAVFIADRELEPGAEAVLATGTEVRLGKKLTFVVEPDDAPSAPPPVVPEAEDEATEDDTASGDGTGENKPVDGDLTRYASPDELNDLRNFQQKQSSRRKIALFLGIAALLLIVGGGWLYAHLRRENPLTWPGEATGRYNDGEFRIHLPPAGKFMIYYPQCQATRVKKNGDNCEVLTLLGKNFDVLFHLKLEVNTLPGGYTLPRRESFERWRKLAEQKLGYSFQVVPEQRFYAQSTCGYPYLTLSYKRRGSDFQWQGLVSYLRYHDREIIFTREVPIQHYWRAERVLNNFGCFVASPDAANSYWEIPEHMPENLSRTDLYRSLLERMADSVAIADWPEIGRRFALLLSAAGAAKDDALLKDTLELLGEFRERQEFWYARTCLAYHYFERNNNWERMRELRNECLTKFPAPDDYRHIRVIKNIWTTNE